MNLYNKYFEYKEVCLDAQFIILNSNIIDSKGEILNYNTYLNAIIKSIQKGMPVHLCIDGITNPVVYKMTKCSYGALNNYQDKPFQPLDCMTSDYKFSKHSVVITGIIIDTVQEKNFIEISSWGTKYIIDFEDLFNKAKYSICTGIIIFRNEEII